ncbi:MAG TPA: glycosyltransferase family 39 protein [Streptosporangiaceae bacterium]|nr:glycosyltransferase family 39 protein [Streptosporangiaceae bacterium]
MSAAPTPQRDKTAVPRVPAGTSGPPASGAATSVGTGGWAATAARYAPAGVVAAAMLVLGFWGIARHNSMGNDEVATRWAALLGLRELAHLLGHLDAVHGLYYLLMHGWMALGTTPTVMRIPSVIAMTVAAVLIVVIGRRLTGSGWVGLFAGLIMVLTPSISFYAQTARSYAMVFACVLGSTLALLYALEAEAQTGGRRRSLRWRWLAYAGLVALGGYLNEMSLLVLAAHAVTVLLARYGRPTFEHWAAAAAGGAVLVVPVALLSIKQHVAIGWINPPGLTDLRVLVQDYFGYEAVAAVLVIICAVVALLPPPGTWRRGPGAAPAGAEPEPAWWRGRGVSLPSVAAPLLVLPAGILLLESLILRPLYVDRYVLYGEAGAALLAGAGIYRIGRWLRDETGQRVLVWAPGVIVCLSLLVLQLAAQHYVRTPGSRRYDYGGPSRYVGAHARPGDGIIFLGRFYRKARLAYPGDFRNTTDFAVARSPLQAGNFQGRDKPSAAVLPLMLDRRRIWVFGGHPSQRRRPGLGREESLTLLSHFRLIRRKQFHNILLTLWQRR